ncbi:arginase family enzyme [Streptomyces sp. SAI-129]
MAGRDSSPRRGRQRGGHAPAADAVDALGGGGLDGFWVRLDADVLDPSVMPTVDSPGPDGLLPDEVHPLRATLLASERCAGLNAPTPPRTARPGPSSPTS